MFLRELAARFGTPKSLPASRSLFELPDGRTRVYVRYSKVHPGGETFFGLRQRDLQQLEGRPGVVCFLWDDQVEPLIIPYAEYEEVFHATSPASDGQYKAQIVYGPAGQAELYIAKAGRFNVEGRFGWAELSAMAEKVAVPPVDLSHWQVQTLLGAIGFAKGYDVWIPLSDRSRCDWSITRRFEFRHDLPKTYDAVKAALQEIDVLWVARGAADVAALYEVEHSTPIYSALLRFNDVHLTAPDLRARYSVVANDGRRSVYARQVNRPTFRTSGLAELCNFLDYDDVYLWHSRIVQP